VRVCSGCGGPRDRGRYRSYCRECHNTHARATRPRHGELSAEARQRANCRSYTHVLIRRGKIVKTPCRCGATDVQVRHLDYADPYAVAFECKVCRADTREAAAA